MKIIYSILIGVAAAIGGTYLGAYLQKNADSKMLRESAARLGLSSEEFNRQILGNQEASNPVPGETAKRQEEHEPVSAPLSLQPCGLKISTLLR
jgi:hypothetical protein